MEQEKKAKQENVVAGIVGALLGSLVGVLCTVIIGQLGYVASISGLVMAVGALKGYELLGGRLSKKGAVISSALILIMTYLAHRLTWAIALMNAAEAGLFDCFRAIPGLLDAGVLEGPAYWGDLVMLYLFTLLGAVPTILGGLRNTSIPDLPLGTAAPAAQGEGAVEAVFYPGNLKWMRPLRLSAMLALCVPILPMVALIILCIANDTALAYSLGSLGCAAAAFVMACFVLPSTLLRNYAILLMVRANGTVWKVSLAMLNNMDTYRFTKKVGVFRAIGWDTLNEEERARAKASVLRAIDLLSSGQVMPGSALSLAVCPLTNLQVIQEDRWKWKCTYSVAGGREKKLSIPKAYPNFAPVNGMEPAQGPVPARWWLLGLAAALTLAFGLVGGGFGHQIDNPGLHGGSPAPTAALPSHTVQPEPAQPSDRTESQSPERYGSVTDEEARALFHVGDELGYSYTAVGYIKAPKEMFGQEGYVDVHIPYSEAPEYLEDGFGIRSAAHGMEVTVTIAQSDESAVEVVDQAYEALKDSGADLYDDKVFETYYFDEYDIAVKQVAYFEENRTKVRIAVLYADYKRDGYYLSASIVYQPELLDEAYPELLAELSDAYALNLPEIEPMEIGQI